MRTLKLRFRENYYHPEACINEGISDLNSILGRREIREGGNLLITRKNAVFDNFDLIYLYALNYFHPKDQQKAKKMKSNMGKRIQRENVSNPNPMRDRAIDHSLQKDFHLN
jgi:hypothetical protein